MIRIDRIVSFTYPRRETAVVGWCCLDDFAAVDELWVEHAGGRLHCLSRIPRPDVVRAYKAPSLAHSGFICRYPGAPSDPVTLIARLGDTEHALGTLSSHAWPQAVEFPEAATNEYATWLRTREPKLHSPTADGHLVLGRLTVAPLISVIVPVYNTSLYHLQRCIDSVAAQLYPNWELCLTDDASTDPRVPAYLQERAARDSRIRLSLSAQNGGISAASNIAVAGSSGEFAVLLDHDDELHPAALLEVVRCLDAHGDADLIYTDEDKIDQIGVRSQPAFKPEFDEDLLCGFDYFGHLVAIRTALVRQVGGFRSDADGAQDWDLLLRVTTQTSRERVRHIAKPLYHWRMHEESTAFSLDAKPQAVRAWNIVLKRHVERDERLDVAEGLFRGSMRVVRPLRTGTRVSIIYRACDGSHQRRAFNRGRVPADVAFYEVMLTALRPADRPDSSALKIVEELQSDVVIVVGCGLDSVNHHFVEELAAQAQREDCGVVGATVLDATGSVVTAGLAGLSDGSYVNPYEGLPLHGLGYMGQAKVVRAVPALSPHAFAFRTCRLIEVNGLASIGEDSLGELCAALVRSAHRSGLKVLHTPYAIATLRAAAPGYSPRQGGGVPGSLQINPNLEHFPSVSAILRAGIH